MIKMKLCKFTDNKIKAAQWICVFEEFIKICSDIRK